MLHEDAYEHGRFLSSFGSFLIVVYTGKDPHGFTKRGVSRGYFHTTVAYFHFLLDLSDREREGRMEGS